MNYTTAHNVINLQYNKATGINLALVYIPSELYNPIVKSYAHGMATIEQTINKIQPLVAKYVNTLAAQQ